MYIKLPTYHRQIIIYESILFYLNYRLPIIQGGTFSFFVPTFAILSLEQFKCPDTFDTKTNKWTNSSMSYEDKTEQWQIRMREIQGAICVAALFQVFIGFSGRSIMEHTN